MGYACDHATKDALLSATSDAGSITHIRQNAYRLDYNAATGGDAMNDPFDQVMMYVYGGWMFHERDAAGNDPEQVPTGDWNRLAFIGTATTPMEDL